MLILGVVIAVEEEGEPVPRGAVSQAGDGFVLEPGSEEFVPVGFNYDHDTAGRLIEAFVGMKMTLGECGRCIGVSSDHGGLLDGMADRTCYVGGNNREEVITYELNLLLEPFTGKAIQPARVWNGRTLG